VKMIINKNVSLFILCYSYAYELFKLFNLISLQNYKKL